MGINIGHFLKNVASAAGKVVDAPIKLAITSTNDIVKVTSKIPVFGPLFHGVLGAAVEPFSFSQSILDGQRIDHALVDSFKRQIADVREVAPYAQAVVSFVPGLGTVASMAIGAGLAIASGRPLDEVAMSAISGAIPGGAIANAAYNVGRQAVVNHKIGGLGTLVTAGLQAAGVNVPPAASQAIGAGIGTLTAMANGQKPDKALLASAINAVPGLAKDVNLDTITPKGLQDLADNLAKAGQSMIPNLTQAQRDAIRNALHTGIAVQHAAALQAMTHAGLQNGGLGRLLSTGYHAINSDAVIRAARASLQGRGEHGFDIGVGVMQHQTTPFQAAAVRSKLSPVDQHGFDVAAALHLGRVLQGASANDGAAAAGADSPSAFSATHAIKAGQAIAIGVAATTDPSHRTAILNTASSTPDGKTGTQAGIERLRAAGQRVSSHATGTIFGKFSVAELIDLLANKDAALAATLAAYTMVAPQWNVSNAVASNEWLQDWKRLTARYDEAKKKAERVIMVARVAIPPNAIIAADDEYKAVLAALSPQMNTVTKGSFQDLVNRLAAVGGHPNFTLLPQPSGGDFDRGAYGAADTAVHTLDPLGLFDPYAPPGKVKQKWGVIAAIAALITVTVIVTKD